MSCTSCIKFTEHSSGEIDIKFILTHYGHDTCEPIIKAKERRKALQQSTRQNTKSKRKKKQLNTELSDDFEGEAACGLISEESELVEVEKTLSDLKHEVISSLWELSCDVEKCTSRNALLNLKRLIQDAKSTLA